MGSMSVLIRVSIQKAHNTNKQMKINTEVAVAINSHQMVAPEANQTKALALAAAAIPIHLAQLKIIKIAIRVNINKVLALVRLHKQHM